jgi:hypothetical protein
MIYKDKKKIIFGKRCLPQMSLTEKKKYKAGVQSFQ